MRWDEICIARLRRFEPLTILSIKGTSENLKTLHLPIRCRMCFSQGASVTRRHGALFGKPIPHGFPEAPFGFGSWVGSSLLDRDRSIPLVAPFLTEGSALTSRFAERAVLHLRIPNENGGE